MLRRIATTITFGLLVMAVPLVATAVPVSAREPAPAAYAAPAAAAESWPYGRSYAPDQVLPRRDKCGGYRIKWIIKPPTRDWSSIIRIFTPSGRELANLLLDVNAPDPKRGSGSFRICRNTVKPGRYRTSMRVIWTDEDGDRRSAPTQPTYFRMTTPRR